MKPSKGSICKCVCSNCAQGCCGREKSNPCDCYICECCHSKKPITDRNPFDNQSKSNYLMLIKQGWASNKALDEMKTSEAALYLTLDTDKEFNEQVLEARKKRNLEVLVEKVMDAATGVTTTITMEFTQRFNENKMPVLDPETGEPVLHCTKKTITKHPPNMAAAEMLLKADCPEKFRPNKDSKKIKALLSNTNQTPEELKQILLERYVKKSKKPE